LGRFIDTPTSVVAILLYFLPDW